MDRAGRDRVRAQASVGRGEDGEHVAVLLDQLAEGLGEAVADRGELLRPVEAFPTFEDEGCTWELPPSPMLACAPPTTVEPSMATPPPRLTVRLSPCIRFEKTGMSPGPVPARVKLCIAPWPALM